MEMPNLKRRSDRLAAKFNPEQKAIISEWLKTKGLKETASLIERLFGISASPASLSRWIGEEGSRISLPDMDELQDIQKLLITALTRVNNLAVQLGARKIEIRQKLPKK